MSEAGRILLVDDEKLFRLSTADLLRREGFHCDCAPEANTALQEFVDESRPYDVLVTDIRMEGNENLEFVQKYQEIDKHTAIIIITGYPSVATAVHSLQLRVAGYLVKPFDFNELLDAAREGVTHSRANRALSELRSGLGRWNQDLKRMDTALTDVPDSEFTSTVNAFIQNASQNIIAAVMDVSKLSNAMAKQYAGTEACEAINCPRMRMMHEAIEETITVLERTKGMFKSKTLGQLRAKLEELVKT